MDDQMTQTNPPLVDSMPTHVVTHDTVSPIMPPRHQKKKAMIIAGAALLVVILAAIGYYIWKKHHHPAKLIATPAQTLEALDAQSAPDKSTMAQKKAITTALEKSSKKVTLTHQQQLDMLNQINK